MYKIGEHNFIKDMQQKEVTRVINHYVAGYIEQKRMGPYFRPVFVASDMVGIEYENNSPVVLKNGAKLNMQQLDELIRELQQLQQFMEARKLVEDLARN